jgi:hypothetical protein
MMLMALNFSSYNKQQEKENQDHKNPKKPQQQPSTENMDHGTQTEAAQAPVLVSESLG